MESFITIVLIVLIVSMICMCGYGDLNHEVEMITSNIYVRKTDLSLDEKII